MLFLKGTHFQCLKFTYLIRASVNVPFLTTNTVKKVCMRKLIYQKWRKSLHICIFSFWGRYFPSSKINLPSQIFYQIQCCKQLTQYKNNINNNETLWIQFKENHHCLFSEAHIPKVSNWSVSNQDFSQYSSNKQRIYL